MEPPVCSKELVLLHTGFQVIKAARFRATILEQFKNKKSEWPDLVTPMVRVARLELYGTVFLRNPSVPDRAPCPWPAKKMGQLMPLGSVRDLRLKGKIKGKIWLGERPVSTVFDFSVRLWKPIGEVSEKESVYFHLQKVYLYHFFKNDINKLDGEGDTWYAFTIS